jgi:hypothetical protein
MMLLRDARRLAVVSTLLGCGRTGLSILTETDTDRNVDMAASGGAGGADDAGFQGHGGDTNRDATAEASPRCSALVASATPSPGARDVPTSSPVAVTLSCVGSPIAQEALTIRLSLRGHDVPGRGVWDADASILSFLPVRSLGLGATYEVHVSDTTGTELMTWSFTTKDGQWGPSEVVARGTALSLALNSAGRGIVIFGRDPGDQLAVSAIRFDIGSGFSTTVDPVRSTSPANLHDLHAGFDAAGAALAAWVEYTGQYTILKSRSQSEGSWEAASSLGSLSKVQQLHHASLRPDGSGLIVWDERGSGTSGVLATSLAPTGEDPPVPLDFGSGGEVSAALLAQGGAWLARGSYAGGLSVKHMTPAGTWESSVPLRSSTIRSVAMATSLDATAIASWTEPAFDGQTMHADGFVRRFMVDGWGDAQALDTRGDRGSSEALGLTVAIDPYGDALALWVTRTTYVVSQTSNSTTYASTHEIRSQRFELQSGWAPAHAELDPEPPSSLAIPALAVDPQGNGLAIWTTDQSVRVNRFRADDAAWQAAAILDLSNGSAMNLAADDRGRAIATWISRGEIRAARFLER